MSIAIRFFAVACTLLLALAPFPAFAGASDKKLDIYWNDTEGGAATLIVTPAGESILIDAGNTGTRDAGRIFKTASEVAGLKKIDYLITTHFHNDHFGGAGPLAKLIPIGTVYDNGVFEGGHDRPNQEYLNFKADQRLVLNPGDSLPLKQTDGSPSISLKCIAARQKFMDAPKGAAPHPEFEHARKKLADGSDNANSIVTVLSFGDFRVYLAGDLTWNMEARLVYPADLIGKVDVYQVTHHGLDQSNNPTVVQAITPTVAIIGNGPSKGSEPHMFETLKAEKSIAGIYQIHKNLNGKGTNGPDEFIANLKPTDQCDGNYIKLSTDPSAKAYVVSIPATKQEAAYLTTTK